VPRSHATGIVPTLRPREYRVRLDVGLRMPNGREVAARGTPAPSRASSARRDVDPTPGADR
jgi:hypothetical protein